MFLCFINLFAYVCIFTPASKCACVGKCVLYFSKGCVFSNTFKLEISINSKLSNVEASLSSTGQNIMKMSLSYSKEPGNGNMANLHQFDLFEQTH